MIKIKQRGLYDCCLAAAASLMEVDYDSVFSPEFQARIEENKGTYDEEVDLVFEMVGMGKRGEGYQHIINYFGWHREMKNWEKSIRLSVLNGLLWGRRALLQVPSLNEPGKSHLIVWNYNEIWDPSNRKTYENLDDVSYEHVWILNECPNYSSSTV